MKSFRTEIEDPIVQQDIIDLEKKIKLFHDEKIDEERFRSLRLARGVYGQRQEGVQMIRIKLPYGKVTAPQLLRIAAVSDEYSTGRLHITTRQDIQIHYVSLDRTPELWAELEKDQVTLREACGNTVRNITASPDAGICPDEPFDVSPYADAMFRFLLRNPVCQEMGRKFKISFSSNDEDTGLSYMHDLGFIPKLKDGKRGFKIMLGGGLGSQPRHADLLYEFLEADQIIPMTEAVLRVFDRYGERSRRLKARMKFLISSMGKEAFVELVDAERKAVSVKSLPIETSEEEITFSDKAIDSLDLNIATEDVQTYETWKKTNVLAQKQSGLYAIGIKVPLGDFTTDKARILASLIADYATGELRFTLKQNILIRHVRETLLPHFYKVLKTLDLHHAGYESIYDITACPGTDTCNLGISSSTGITKELERVLQEEYPTYVNNKELYIKISGCMNACGQHNMSPIGFQGMSIRSGKLVAPALQVLLGGSILHNGNGRFADKIIKIPSRRGPQALRLILDDFEKNGKNSSFVDYYDQQGERYFYELLTPLSGTDNLTQEDFIDWGHQETYKQEVGVGECAGVVIDLVATLLFESEEKLDQSAKMLSQDNYANSIYYAYSVMINTAKAILTADKVKTNTYASIVESFETTYVDAQKIELSSTFADLVYQIKNNEPTKEFATRYYEQASDFYQKVAAYRTAQLQEEA